MIKYHRMTIEDYNEVIALWRTTEGVGLDEDSDSRGKIAAYLERNSDLSFVARRDGKLIGAVLCGHDGRRGYLHHLAVSSEERGQGIGRALVDKCLDGLDSIGIPKCNIFIFADNTEGQQFWQKIGWLERPDLLVMQKKTSAK